MASTLDADALGGAYDLVVAAVPHAAYRALSAEAIRGLVKAGGCVADLKGIWRGRELGGVERWSL